MSFFMASVAFRGWAANHSSKPAMRPASPPAVSTAGKPERAGARRDARMRRERGATAPRRACRRVDNAPQVVEPFARRDGDGVDAALRERLGEPGRAGSAAARGDSTRRNPRARRARAACRPDARARPRRGRSARACRAASSSSGNASRPSLSKLVAGTRASAMPASASASAVPGPGANAINPAGQRRASGAPYSTALADTNTAIVILARAPHARVRAPRDPPAAESRSPER